VNEIIWKKLLGGVRLIVSNLWKNVDLSSHIGHYFLLKQEQLCDEEHRYIFLSLKLFIVTLSIFSMSMIHNSRTFSTRNQ